MFQDHGIISIFDNMLHFGIMFPRNMARWALALFTGLMILSMLSSCSSHTTKTRKRAARQMEKENKRSEKAYKKDVKRHLKIQSDYTRKMMKQSRKQSKKYNKKKIREPFGHQLYPQQEMLPLYKECAIFHTFNEI